MGEMPLPEVLQALSKTPPTQRQHRAALAFTAARWAHAKGEGNEALKLLESALKMVPDLRPAMRMLSRIYADKDDIRNAVTFLDQEIRATRHPREAAALYRERGLLVESHFNDLKAAQQCHEAALQATPNDLAVLRAVERVCLLRGDLFATIANLEAQLEVVSDAGASASLMHELARLETRRGGDLSLAIRLTPDRAQVSTQASRSPQRSLSLRGIDWRPRGDAHGARGRGR